MIGYTSWRIQTEKGSFMKKTPLLILVASTTLFFAGCGSTPSAPMIKNPHYSLGEQDGCATAKGTYTKNSELFRNNPDYEKGWFAGRQYCNPSFHK